MSDETVTPADPPVQPTAGPDGPAVAEAPPVAADIYLDDDVVWRFRK